MWIYYAGAGIIASLIILCVILLFVSKSKKKALNMVDLKLPMNHGEVRAFGVREEYLITVSDQYQYLVRHGEIVAVKDLTKPDSYKEYMGGQYHA
jgi:ABC-type protease/lipase transport system fused ATPase/permease subunit